MQLRMLHFSNEFLPVLCFQSGYLGVFQTPVHCMDRNLLIYCITIQIFFFKYPKPFEMKPTSDGKDIVPFRMSIEGIVSTLGETPGRWMDIYTSTNTC